MMIYEPGNLPMIWYRKFLLSDHESLIVLHVTENCVGQPSTDSSFLHGLIAPFGMFRVGLFFWYFGWRVVL